jgi:putative peptidoglycan lipid II flippase
LTAQATRYYILSLPFFLFWPVLLKACQVRNNFFFPIIAVFLFAVLNAVLKYVFVVRLQLGLKGIAASTFVGYFFLCVSLYIYLFFKENECNATEEC